MNGVFLLSILIQQPLGRLNGHCAQYQLCRAGSHCHMDDKAANDGKPPTERGRRWNEDIVDDWAFAA